MPYYYELTVGAWLAIVSNQYPLSTPATWEQFPLSKSGGVYTTP